MKNRQHQHRPASLRVGKSRRRSLYLLLLVLVASGLWWLLIHNSSSEDALPNPLLSWLMKIHGGAAMLTTFLAGTFLYTHIVNAWQQGRNRIAGAFTAGGMALIALSGYGLYYFDGEGLRGMAEWLHWIVGFSLPALLWWHIARGRKQRRETRKIVNFPHP